MGYYYCCPYCQQGKLVEKKLMDLQCEHESPLLLKKYPFLNKKCKELDYKCKEVLHCEDCDSYFKKTDEFLAEQIRKQE